MARPCEVSSSLAPFIHRCSSDTEPKRYCSLAQFVEGNDIARKSFKRSSRSRSASMKLQNLTVAKETDETDNPMAPGLFLDALTQDSDASSEVQTEVHVPPESAGSVDESKYTEEVSEKEIKKTNKKNVPHISFVIDPPSPALSDEVRHAKFNETRRHSSHTPSLLAPKEMEINRRHSGNNPSLLGLDPQRVKFLNCSPAATRRISCGSLFKPNESMPLGSSRANLLSGSKMFGRDEGGEDYHRRPRKSEIDALTVKKLPIINPLVRLPSWPSKTFPIVFEDSSKTSNF